MKHVDQRGLECLTWFELCMLKCGMPTRSRSSNNLSNVNQCVSLYQFCVAMFWASKRSSIFYTFPWKQISKAYFCIDFWNRNSRRSKPKTNLQHDEMQTNTRHLSRPVPVCGINRAGTCGGAPLKETHYRKTYKNNSMMIYTLKHYDKN